MRDLQHVGYLDSEQLTLPSTPLPAISFLLSPPTISSLIASGDPPDASPNRGVRSGYQRSQRQFRFSPLLSLTCSAFLPRARYYLFSRIVIRSVQQIEASCQLVDSCPWLLPLVRKVTLPLRFPRITHSGMSASSTSFLSISSPPFQICARGGWRYVHTSSP